MIRCIYNLKFQSRCFHLISTFRDVSGLEWQPTKKTYLVIFLTTSVSRHLSKTAGANRRTNLQVVGLTGFVFEGVAISLALYLKEAIQHPDGERPKMCPNCGSIVVDFNNDRDVERLGLWDVNVYSCSCCCRWWWWWWWWWWWGWHWQCLWPSSYYFRLIWIEVDYRLRGMPRDQRLCDVTLGQSSTRLQRQRHLWEQSSKEPGVVWSKLWMTLIEFLYVK